MYVCMYTVATMCFDGHIITQQMMHVCSNLLPSSQNSQGIPAHHT